MNSLNVLSSLRSSQAKASNRGLGTNLSEKDENQASRAAEEREAEADDISDSKTEDDLDSDPLLSSLGGEDGNDYASTADPKRPLLADSVSASSGAKGLGANGRVRRTSKKVASAAFCALRIILQAFIAPARFILTCFRNDDGSLSALSPLRRLNRAFYRPRRKTKGTKEHKASVAAGLDTSSSQGLAEKYQTLQNGSGEVDAGNLQTVPTTFSDSEQDTEGTPDREKGPLESAHSHKDERPTSGRIWRLRSTNVKQQNQSKKRNGRTSPSSEQQHNLDQEPAAAAVTAALLKSPTGPGSTLMATKYPQARLPRHPLLPRRQPSYNTGYFSSREPQKTLILDLDETLIHSMAKGGRMSTGHMVEVRLQRPVGISGTIIESQLPILYYVHKRPHCDEFLKKVCKWYKVVIFTASVQEYADPVIDWLEQERQYFSGRYYRQHCTFRNGAYIKDISQVEPDLSRVMILDNSPISYVFHGDNAIPIEGWLSDPTDNGLLNIIPMLESIQHVTDVRALLALRLGEPTAA